MPSTYSDLLRFEKQANGENDTTWGAKLNAVVEMIEDAISGRAAVSMTDANYTLTTANSTTDEARMAILNIASSVPLTANRNVVVPTSSKKYIVKNATTGGFSIVVKTTAGTGITIPNGRTMAVYCDATNVVVGEDWAQLVEIVDTSLNELIKFTTTASAVNEITVANAATGGAPALSATGGDTDIGLSITPKGAGVLALGGAVADTGVVSPAQITANQNDYAGAASASVARINSDARRSLTGLAGGVSGRKVTLHNVGTFPILFKFEDTNSAAGNRFAFGHTLSGGHSMKIQYDATTSRWRCVYREDPAGTLKDFAGGTVPEGYFARDGSNVSRATYASLFNEVGTTWGVGDGSTTFGVGDDRRRTAVGVGGSGTATLANSVGSTGGAETHTLTSAEQASMSVATTDVQQGLSTVASGPSIGQLAAGAAVYYENMTATGTATGGGGAHNNVQPSYVVTKVIKY